MSNKKVSVVIPVYGVEAYIERCVRSLFEQTLEDIEYIFIDDCTPDRSISIINQLEEEYHQQLVLQDKSVVVKSMPRNSGSAEARKCGIQFCTGEYIIHCDSDDWMELDMLQKMYEKAKSMDADIVMCGYSETDGINILKRCYNKSDDKNKLIPNLLTLKESCSLWNKLCKRTLYDNQIIFPTLSMGEDMALTMQLVLNAEQIGIVPEVLYNYFYNANSITKDQSESSRHKHWLESAKNAEIVESVFVNKGLEHDFEQEIVYLKFLQKKLAGNLSRKRKYSGEWLRMFHEINMKVFCLPSISISEKLKYGITMLFAKILRAL